MNEPKLDATFEFSRWSDDVFRLTITDKASGLMVMYAEVSPASLALAMGGRGCMPMKYEPTLPYVAERIGMVCTRRRVFLSPEVSARAHKSRPRYNADSAEKVEFDNWMEVEALKALKEEDGESYCEGWSLWHSGATSQQKTLWEVVMERFDAPETEPEKP